MDFNSMLSNLKRKAEITAASGNKEGPAKRGKPEIEINKLKEMKRSRPFPKEKVDKIFLVCPPKVQTGGPEAMHQLCDKINASASEISAFMLYIEERSGEAYHVKDASPLNAYSIYPNIKVCHDWNNDSANVDSTKSRVEGDKTFVYSNSLVIWPEIWTNLIDSLQGRHQNSIWWLSVNNNNGQFREWLRKDILHLYQSEYARCHIMKNLKKACSAEADENIDSRVLSMTEYIPPQRQSPELKVLPRDLDVLYNPLKGIHYTDDIRKRSDAKFHFTPIGGEKRITPTEVTKLLHRAKVYIDFGPHPGMDRLPREAAIANCIVITNRDGAAFYNKDVPIPDCYKFSEFNVEAIHQVLKKSIDDYEGRKLHFDSYREWISTQELKMKACVDSLMEKICTERS